MSAKLTTARTAHIGLRLTPEVRGLLDALVADEQAKVGPVAKVTATTMLEALVLQEAARRSLSIESRKTHGLRDHMEDVARVTSSKPRVKR